MNKIGERGMIDTKISVFYNSEEIYDDYKGLE
jgi:hypothetical protein